MSRENSIKAWRRNGFLGRLANLRKQLSLLNKEANQFAIGSETVALISASLALDKLDNIPIKERHRIFGTIHKFKKYEKI